VFWGKETLAGDLRAKNAHLKRGTGGSQAEDIFAFKPEAVVVTERASMFIHSCSLVDSSASSSSSSLQEGAVVDIRDQVASQTAAAGFSSKFTSAAPVAGPEDNDAWPDD